MDVDVPVITRARPGARIGLTATLAAGLLAAGLLAATGGAAVAVPDRSPGLDAAPPIPAAAAAAAPAGRAVAPDELLRDEFADGDAAGWRTSGGRWQVADEAGLSVYRQSGTSSDARARAGDAGWTDYSVTARVRPGGVGSDRSRIGVLARVQDDRSYYYLTLRGNHTIELGKVVRGRLTPLASAPAAVNPGYWSALTLVVKGGTLVGSGGGRSLSAADTELGAGRIGLTASYAAAAFDDVVVHPYTGVGPDTRAPTAPGNVRVPTVTPSTATLTWTASVDNVAVVDYLVYQGDQFYSIRLVRVVPHTGPVELTLSPTAATTHLAVAARDAAGNVSSWSHASVPAPPSYPKSGDDTVAPSAPGAPVVEGVAEGGFRVSWTPATDNVGVREYHVILTRNIDEVRLVARVSGTTAVVPGSGGDPYSLLRVIAYDAAWNSASGPMVPFRPGTPTPTPPPA